MCYTIIEQKNKGFIMTAKKITSIVALALTASLLTACSGTQKITFNPYWNLDVFSSENIHEVLKYDVRFEKGSDYGYELDYAGTYTTTLQRQTTAEGHYYYLYETELLVDVTYTLGEESRTLTDHVTTEVTFHTAEDGLAPISSKKSVVSSSPLPTQHPTSLEDCYQIYDYELTTVYEEKTGAVTLTQKDKTTEQHFKIDNDLSYLDNEQLLLSLRAMSTSVSSAQLLAYSPFTASTQKISVSFDNSSEGKFEFNKNGTAVTLTVPYRPVQMQINDKNSGFAQTVWIAKPTSTTSNTHRNVMLRLETPIYQGFGTLIYELASADYL